MSDLLGRIRAAWDNLSAREQLLVSAAGSIVLMMVLSFAIVAPLLAASDNARERADMANRQLNTMIRLRGRYDAVQARLEAVESRIRNNSRAHNTLTFLETLARRAGVAIDSMQERKAADDERYKETRVEVSLTGVTLRDTMDFLHKIESAREQFSVKSLRIKRRADDSSLLNVTFSVSSFKAL